MLPKDLFQPGKRFEELVDSLIVRLLAGGETGLIDAVIDVVIDPAIQLVNLRPQCWRVVVTGTRTLRPPGYVMEAWGMVIANWTRVRPSAAARMMRLAELIESQAQEIAELESLDSGKPVEHIKFVDIGLSVDALRYNI